MFNSAKVAIKIIEYAKKQGISQKYLCERLELSRTYILDVKNGKAKITPDRLAIIADLLHTTPEYLMDETDDPTPIKKEPPTEQLSPKKQAFIDWISTADENTIDFLLSVAEKFEAQRKK